MKYSKSQREQGASWHPHISLKLNIYAYIIYFFKQQKGRKQSGDPVIKDSVKDYLKTQVTFFILKHSPDQRRRAVPLSMLFISLHYSACHWYNCAWNTVWKLQLVQNTILGTKRGEIIRNLHYDVAWRPGLQHRAYELSKSQKASVIGIEYAHPCLMHMLTLIVPAKSMQTGRSSWHSKGG